MSAAFNQYTNYIDNLRVKAATLGGVDSTGKGGLITAGGLVTEKQRDTFFTIFPTQNTPIDS